MNKSEEWELKLHPRQSETISLEIPTHPHPLPGGEKRGG